jgi:acyl-CoA synthetase (AMP-forming)/AMP-acid ligase II
MSADADAAELRRARGLDLGAQLAAAARKRPERMAMRCDDDGITYAQLDARADRVARALADRGVGLGDRVLIVMTNRFEFVEAFFGICRLGAIAVPVNFRLVAAEIADLVADADPVAAVVDAGLAARLAEALAAVDGVGVRLVVGDDPSAAGPGGEGYEAALAGAAAAPPTVDVPADAAAVICFTSGTTGRAKGAVLTHANLAINALSVMIALGIRADDEVWASGLPLFHVGGFTDMLLHLGVCGTFVMLSSHDFDAARTVDVLAREGVTGCSFVPTQWQAICAVPGIRERRLPLRRAGWSTAVSPMALLELLAETFPGVDQINAFGQTEMGPTTTILNGPDAVRKMGSVGRPLANVELRIVDDEMRDVAVGEVGEVVYRGPCVFAGYWRAPAATAEAFAGGWFHSGDLCRMDDEGYVYVVDRKKDMIISGGENIYSAELENAIAGHPLVAEVAVVGLPHETWGETPCAAVVPADPSRPPTHEQIAERCRARLASYKKPTRIVVVDALPRNASGKVLKQRLREQLTTNERTV